MMTWRTARRAELLIKQFDDFRALSISWWEVTVACVMGMGTICESCSKARTSAPTVLRAELAREIDAHREARQASMRMAFSYLLLLLLMALPLTGSAFASSSSSLRMPFLSGSTSTLAKTSQVYTMQASPPPQEENEYPGQPIVRAVLDVFFNIQKVFFDGLAAALFVGLLVNLLGFGYTFDESGLVVKPLSAFRQDVADERFTRAATRLVNDPAPAPASTVDSVLRLRGGSARLTASAPPTNGALASLRRRWLATVGWMRSHAELLVHAAICVLATHDAVDSVLGDQWRAIRLHPEVVRQRGDAILKRRRRAAQVADLLGAGYTPRIVFLAGLMLRSVQMSTGIVRAFDPSLGYGAGATLAARWSQREWIPCILLGWGVGGLYWSSFHVRPPGVEKDAMPMRFH